MTLLMTVYKHLQLYSTKKTSNKHNSKSLSNYSNLLLKSYDKLRHGNRTELFFIDNESGKGLKLIHLTYFAVNRSMAFSSSDCICYLYRPAFTNTSQYNVLSSFTNTSIYWHFFALGNIF